jgi:hypothetical protein
MDPDVLLDNLRTAVKSFMSVVNDDSYTSDDVVNVAEDIVYMFDNLDQWLASGGFIPAVWNGRDPRHLALT